MSKTATIQARINGKLKRQADIILYKIGLTASQAINTFYAQIVLHKGMPFELKIPSDTTFQAIHELENGKGKNFSNFHEMIKDLEHKDA